MRLTRRDLLKGMAATAAGILLPERVAAEPERRIWALDRTMAGKPTVVDVAWNNGWHATGVEEGDPNLVEYRGANLFGAPPTFITDDWMNDTITMSLHSNGEPWEMTAVHADMEVLDPWGNSVFKEAALDGPLTVKGRWGVHPDGWHFQDTSFLVMYDHTGKILNHWDWTDDPIG
jgi:hypothetical protein